MLRFARDFVCHSLVNQALKPVRLSEHAKEQLLFRGCTEIEIIEAIRSSTWQPAERGRLECRMTMPFNRQWNGRHYGIKTVRPIFVEQKETIVVVTVYVYYQ